MPPTDHRHAKAVKLALTQIDANLNRYDTTQKQIRMLRDLTDANELKMHPKGSGSEDLTAEKYHAKMQSLLINHSKIKGTKRKGGPTIISQLFAKGSAVIDHEYLDQIGYERPPVIGKIQARTRSRVDVFAKGDDADKLLETQQRPQMPTTAPSSLQIARNHLQSAQRPLPTPTETSSPKISESDNTTATKRNEPYSLRVSSWSEDTLSEGGLSDDNTSEGATSESDLSDYEFREDASTIGTANEEGPSDDTSGAHDLTGDGLKEPPAESHHNADMASARDPDIADEKQMPSPAATNNTAAMDRESEGYSTGSAAAGDDDPKDTGSTSPLIERTTDLLVTDDSIAVGRLQPSHDTYSTQVLQQRQRIGSHHEAIEHNTNVKRKSADSQRDATISKRRRIESENRNISTIPASSRSHEDALTDPKKPRQIEPVATSLIRQHLDTIKSLTRSCAIDVLKDLGVDPMGAARLVVNPTQELEALYQTVFGDKWEHQAFRLYLADDLRAYEVLQSLVTAAWFDILFQNKLGLPDAEAMIQGLIKLEPHANIVSERHCEFISFNQMRYN